MKIDEVYVVFMPEGPKSLNQEIVHIGPSKGEAVTLAAEEKAKLIKKWNWQNKQPLNINDVETLKRAVKVITLKEAIENLEEVIRNHYNPEHYE